MGSTVAIAIVVIAVRASYRFIRLPFNTSRAWNGGGREGVTCSAAWRRRLQVLVEPSHHLAVVIRPIGRPCRAGGQSESRPMYSLADALGLLGVGGGICSNAPTEAPTGAMLRSAGAEYRTTACSFALCRSIGSSLSSSALPSIIPINAMRCPPEDPPIPPSRGGKAH